MAPPRLFVAGPPGTGKTVVLLLMAIEWLRSGNDVYIVSIWRGSLAASFMLYHLLLQTVNSQETGRSSGQPHFLHCLTDDDQGNVEKAVEYLKQKAKDRLLYVIADNASVTVSYFPAFCTKLLKQVPRLHLWAASCYHRCAPAHWEVKFLTKTIRSPLAVVREVQQDEAIAVDGEVRKYNARVVSDHTDGPPVRRLFHRGQGHSGVCPGDCVTCGREVARFLHSLRVDIVNVTTSSNGTTPPCLQWKDVLVLSWYKVTDKSGVVTGMREEGIPVWVMMEDGDIKDVATARSDVVWVAEELCVGGLERKVVVCLDFSDWKNLRLHSMSRCTSQLVIVSPDGL